MGPIYRFFGGPPLWVMLRLLVLSLVVGIVLSFLGIHPFDVWYLARDLAETVWYMGFDALGELGQYLVIGAIIVIPIWIVMRILRMGSGRP
ncbi:DUF6460 domain-containing protein [Lutibaculum baratangense]|uniref:DUF6460 domain-containing protein n=1 Tax=Lutibaculum baratangense AMV1 TaxID=631454 RepID=V4TKQ9_9HYPH|nr:DUF6460 domain-containing protein [Lutibaculum baratangense]ESR26408.1 hypothetical protein N177_0908 [Lutibaculum baratangense AMV1]